MLSNTSTAHIRDYVGIYHSKRKKNKGERENMKHKK